MYSTDEFKSVLSAEFRPEQALRLPTAHFATRGALEHLPEELKRGAEQLRPHAKVPALSVRAEVALRENRAVPTRFIVGPRPRHGVGAGIESGRLARRV